VFDLFGWMLGFGGIDADVADLLPLPPNATDLDGVAVHHTNDFDR